MEVPEEFIGKQVTSVPSPAFLVSETIVKQNCQKLLERCKQLNIQLRPHVKTHKTLEGALLQTGGRKSGLVVSTVAEAWFYVNAGFTDIVLGTPATPYLFRRCAGLRKQALIHFFINSPEGVRAAQEAGNDGSPISSLLKISTGYERAGISWSNTEEIICLARELVEHPNTTFAGLYVHCGNSYNTDRSSVNQVRDDSVVRLLKIRDALKEVGIECNSLGIGSTPSCSLPPLPIMNQLSELHTGNYAFYDCQQESYGACSRSEIAGRVMTRVKSHHPDRNQILVDLGFTGLTRQGLDLAVPGYAAIQGHPNLKLSAMTQELGKIETIDGSQIDFPKFPIDSPLFLYPYHACAAAGLYAHYYVHDSSGTITAVWKPTRGW